MTICDLQQTTAASGLHARKIQTPRDTNDCLQDSELTAIWDEASLQHEPQHSPINQLPIEEDQINATYSDCRHLNRNSVSTFTSSKSTRPPRLFSQGTITLLVEGDEFLFDRVLFSGVSSRLSQAFETASNGLVDMNGVTQEDVERLHEILSKSGKTLSYEQCSAIFRIHSEWPMNDLHARALRCLDAWIGPSSVQRVQLGRRHQIYNWVDQGLGELAVRQQDLTDEEKNHLEICDSECVDIIKPYAVASEAENITFHKSFPRVPSWDRLLTYYMCALQGRVLLQGWMYITKAHLCFTSTVGGETMIMIPFADVVTLEKCYTALCIPNGITITTSDEQQLVFRSFIQRGVTFTLLDYLKNISSGRL